MNPNTFVMQLQCLQFQNVLQHFWVKLSVKIEADLWQTDAVYGVNIITVSIQTKVMMDLSSIL